MTVININTVPNEGLPDLMTLFEGVSPTAADKLANMTAASPMKDADAVRAALIEVGVSEPDAAALLDWFSADDDPCDCWHKININDIPAEETARLFARLTGIDGTTAETLETIRLSAPRPADGTEWSAQLSEAGVPAALIERLGLWFDAERLDDTNTFNCAEFEEAYFEIPILEDVSPIEAAPGDTIRLSLNRVVDDESHVVHVNGYPAEITAIDPKAATIDAKVPDDVFGPAEVGVTCGGMASPFTVPIETLPTIRREDCPDSIDAHLTVLGTADPVLIDVTEVDPVSGEPSTRTLETEFTCGTNSVAWRGGHSASPIQTSFALNSIASPALAGLATALPVLASVVYVQIVRRKETVNGKEVYRYYFHRNGKWWKITDPKQMHPDAPTLIDVREGPDPNFTEADAATQTSLDKKFFPDNWELAWRAWDAAARRDFQIMWALLWQMNGLGEEEAKVLFDIKRRLDAGESAGSILDRYWKFILFRVLLVAATAGAGVLLKRLFQSMWVKRLVEKVTSEKKTRKGITLEIKKALRSGEDIPVKDKTFKGGLRGHISGEVNRKRRTLDCKMSFVEWQNLTEKRGFATEVFRNWIERLKKYARQRGLKAVWIERLATTDKGKAMLERLGFTVVKEYRLASGKIARKMMKRVPVD